MTDAEAAKFYDDPENREAVGPPRRRTKKPLSTHVPVRFAPETISRVRVLADQDGQTVSSWIRGVVEREVDRRSPSETELSPEAKEFVTFYSSDVGASTTTGRRLVEA